MPAITIRRTFEAEATVSVEFPVFVRSWQRFDHGARHSTIYRLDADGTLYSITRRDDIDGSVAFKIDRDRIDLVDAADYLKPERPGFEPATAEDYDRLYAELVAFVEAFPA